MADEPAGWARVRHWLRMGPTRAELVAEAELWRARCERKDGEKYEAHARAKAAEKDLRQAEARIREMQSRLNAVVNAGLNEPGRVEGCAKVRFHWQPEAAEWVAIIVQRTGGVADALNTYQCNVCPRSPVTVQRYWHVGHLGTKEAQAAKAAGVRRRNAQEAAARRDGKLLEQRVDPAVLAQLRKLREGG